MRLYYGKNCKSAFGLFYHLVIVTKSRDRFFLGAKAKQIEEIIKENCSKNDYLPLEMAVQPNHVHMLLQTKPTVCVSKMVQNIKGYSSYIFNKRFPNKENPLEWQSGYSIDTVSKELLEKVERYIKNQIQD